MADESYATLADLKKVYKPAAWSTETEEDATDKIATASAMVRQAFRNRGADLNKRIADGRIESTILKDLICRAVKRDLTVAAGPLGATDYQSLSQAVGPISTTIVKSASSTDEGSLYFKKSELEYLGMPTTLFGSLKTYNPVKEADPVD